MGLSLVRRAVHLLNLNEDAIANLSFYLSIKL